MTSVTKYPNGPRPSTTETDTRLKEREAHTLAKHREDVSSLRAAHREELARQQQTFEEREKKIETRHATAMTEKDLDHQREIDKLRKMYAQRMKSEA